MFKILVYRDGLNSPEADRATAFQPRFKEFINLCQRTRARSDRFQISIDPDHHHPPEKAFLKKISLETGNF